ncbi:MAG TPA: GNAT family protein [Marmoricola sp.]|nr:GNAT family protein [Marmoricola sp.]
MTAPDWATKPTVVGERVTLRPFRPGDAELMQACFDEEAIRLTGSAHSTEEARRIVAAGLEDRTRQWYATRNDQADRLDLAVEDSSGVLVGEVVLNDWEPGNRSCGFRILLGPRGRNRGLGTEATRLIIDHAFDVLGLHRVELEVYAFNPRAAAAYRKAGFVEEGRRRDALAYDDEWFDAVVMSVIATDRRTAR